MNFLQSAQHKVINHTSHSLDLELPLLQRKTDDKNTALSINFRNNYYFSLRIIHLIYAKLRETLILLFFSFKI